MKKYTVQVTLTINAEIEVSASSKEEALEKAKTSYLGSKYTGVVASASPIPWTVQESEYKLLSELRIAAKNPHLTIEERPGRGWFIMERGQTMLGFDTEYLLKKYIGKVKERSGLYIPTVSETYRK